MRTPKQIAKEFCDHFIGRMPYRKGDDGLCRECVGIARRVQIEVLEFCLGTIRSHDRMTDSDEIISAKIAEIKGKE